MSVSPIAALPLLLLTASTLPAGQSLLHDIAEANVNQRYTIESVSIAGVHVEDAKIPGHLRRRLNALIGEHCDAAELADLATELRKELHLKEVTQRLSRGSQPGSIQVNFEVVRKEADFDISVPRFLYRSQQGFTGEMDAGAQLRQNNNFSFSILSNGDNLTERFTGIAARYEDESVGTDKLRFGIAFEDYHEQWSAATQVAAESVPGFDLYRTRRNIAPHLTLVVAKALSVSAGTSFEQMDPENPGGGLRSANALTTDAQYGSKIGSDAVEQTVDASYSLRVGMRGLGSDYSYARHVVTVRYEVKSGRQMASEEIMGGTIAGNAPSFERFVLGTSSTLRGWDRYSLDPLGGTRVVHNSLTYGYRVRGGTAQIFYDCGALWDAERTAQLRHSVGVGYRQGVFVLTMALPVSMEGHITPVFMAGMNY
jgi:hypothetical protein